MKKREKKKETKNHGWTNEKIDKKETGIFTERISCLS